MMKKIVSLLIAGLMMLTLVACGFGDKGDNDGGGGLGDIFRQLGEDGQQSEDPIGDQIQSGLEGITNPIYDDLSEAEKQALIDEAREDGVDISFTPDGKMVATDEDGTVMVQNPDGTWAVQNEDGSVGQIGGEWPSNEFTALLPKPDFELFAANVSETEFSVSFLSAGIEQIRAYAEKVKAAGFTIDASTEDQAMMGIVLYSYTASHPAGYRVEIFSAMGVSGLTVTK